MPTLVYRHDGPIWKAEAGAGYAHSKDHTAAGDRGWFAITAMTRPDVTVNADGFDLLRPGKITLLDGGNRPPGRSIRHHQLHDHDDQRAGAQGRGCEGQPLRQPAARFQTGRRACPHSKAAWIGNTRSATRRILFPRIPISRISDRMGGPAAEMKAGRRLILRKSPARPGALLPARPDGEQGRAMGVRPGQSPSLPPR
jgi:hypothetical protein